MLALLLATHTRQDPATSRGQTQTGNESANRPDTAVTRPRTADDRIADYTLWLTVLTGALVGVSLFQGVFIWRGDRTARKSAQAAQDAVAAATIGQRAYVFVDTSQTGQTSKETGRLHSNDLRHFHVINLGNTPARIDSYVAVMHFWEGQHFRDVGIPTIHEFWLDSKATSGKMDMEVILTDEAIAKARTGRGDGTVGISGYVRYRDVFGRCHETTFCFAFKEATHELSMIVGEGLNETRPIPCE